MEDGKFYEGGAVRRVENALSVKRFMDKAFFGASIFAIDGVL